MAIRNSAKAVIIEDGKLLTVKFYENGSTYYILPGGGQEHGENLHQALIRECKEEIGADIEIGDLIFVREYIGKNHELAAYHSHAHQVEFMFICTISDGNILSENGTNPDKGQIGVEWLPISKLLEYQLFPRALRSYLIDYSNSKEVQAYVGDIN